MRSYNDPDPEACDGCLGIIVWECAVVVFLVLVLALACLLSSCSTPKPHDITVTTTPGPNGKTVVHVQVQQPQPSLLDQALSGIISGVADAWQYLTP